MQRTSLLWSAMKMKMPSEHNYTYRSRWLLPHWANTEHAAQSETFLSVVISTGIVATYRHTDAGINTRIHIHTYIFLKKTFCFCCTKITFYLSKLLMRKNVQSWHCERTKLFFCNFASNLSLELIKSTTRLTFIIRFSLNRKKQLVRTQRQ